MKTFYLLASFCVLLLIGSFYLFSDWTITDQPSPVSHSSTGRNEPNPAPASDLPVMSPIQFESVAKNWGIDFTYYGSPTQRMHMIEQNGGGVALFDYDNNGLFDLYFVNGSKPDAPAKDVGMSCELFQQEQKRSFSKVTLQTGLSAFGYGMGCSTGDYDNDGFSDLYVAYYGSDRLYRNNGDGTFYEVGSETGIDNPLWGTSPLFADLDGDGDHDIYVANYVEYSLEDDPCYTQHQPPIQITCGPQGRQGQPDVLFENLGNGQFKDISEQAGVAIPHGKGLAVLAADLTSDGLVDIYVANDATENLLFENLGGMKFYEVGLIKGVALGDSGQSQASMGIGCADYNLDGDLDLVVTNFENETCDFYEQTSEGGFQPVNQSVGLSLITRPTLGFGVVMTDFDSDAFADIFVANGHVWDLTSLGVGYEFEMKQHLLRNVRGSRFQEVTDSVGAYFNGKHLARAVASGDLDNDGDTDLIVTHLKSPAAVLENQSMRFNRSLLVEFVGKLAARQPLGMTVQLDTDEFTCTHLIPAGGSFQSASDPRLVLPLRNAANARLTAAWSPGRSETWKALEPTSSAYRLVLEGENAQ